MENKELFEELGLSGNGGKVYEDLVKFGKLSASEVSAKSGVPYGKIYVVLESLIHKGLVEVVPEKTKKFVPSSPENLIKLVEEKQKVLEKAKEKARSMKQFYEVKEKNPVIMAQGRKGFYKVVEEMEKAGKYAYSIKWTSEFKPEWVKEHKANLRKGVDLRMLSRYDKETKRDVDDWLKINKNVRKIENEGVAFAVNDDKEVLIGLIRNNVTLLIRDKAFAKVMKKLFLAYYEHEAEDIK